AAEPRRQPARAEGGRGGDRQQLLAAGDLGDGPAQRLEGLARRRQQASAGRGEGEAPRAALEQLDPELALVRADLVGDRRRGDVQLLGRLAEAQAPGGGLEDSEGW